MQSTCGDSACIVHEMAFLARGCLVAAQVSSREHQFLQTADQQHQLPGLQHTRSSMSTECIRSARFRMLSSVSQWPVSIGVLYLVGDHCISLFLPDCMSKQLNVCRARYRGKGTDLSKVDQFKRHEADVGSTEIQIARISARVTQLTGHLQTHRKDYASTRGLIILLGQRRRLLQYIYKHNR